MPTGIPASPPPSSEGPGKPAGPPKPGWLRIDSRFVPPIFITLILVVGDLTYGILEDYRATGLAILTAILMELVLGRLVTGKWPHLASAYISGISVGILIRSPFLWPYALCSALSIVSKYALRVRGRHIWNPSNFGITLMLVLAADHVASLSLQWGNEIWPMFIIWCLGCLIVYRFNRLNITLTYVISFVVFAKVRSLITGFPFLAEVAPITGPMYQLYIFFMITDPKTTTRYKWSQCLVAFLIAVVEMCIRLYGSLYGVTWAVHAPYFALFIVGPIANLIEIWLTPARKPAAAVAAAAGAPSRARSTAE
jgi:hypothetical protein